MVKLIEAASPTLRVIIVGAFVLASLFIAAGIWLVYLGATGETTIEIADRTFSSTNVGIVAMAIGAFTAIAILRRSLSTFDNVVLRASTTPDLEQPTGVTEHPPEPGESAAERPAPIQAWPSIQNDKTLGQALKALSNRQGEYLKLKKAQMESELIRCKKSCKAWFHHQTFSTDLNPWNEMGLLSWIGTAFIYQMTYFNW